MELLRWRCGDRRAGLQETTESLLSRTRHKGCAGMVCQGSKCPLCRSGKSAPRPGALPGMGISVAKVDLTFNYILES